MSKLFGWLLGRTGPVTLDAARKLALEKAATEVFEQGMTKAGRALTKHPEILGLTKDNIRKVLPTNAALNAAGEAAVKRILNTGQAVVRDLPRYGLVLEVRTSGVAGARFLDETGEFIGFIRANP